MAGTYTSTDKTDRGYAMEIISKTDKAREKGLVAIVRHGLNMDRLFATSPRFIATGILILSVVGKIYDPDPFLILLDVLGFSKFMAYATLLLLVILEASTAVLLILRPKVGTWLGMWLFAFFTLIVAYLYAINIIADCGCFGGLVASEIGPAKMVQNLSILLMLTASLYFQKQ